MPESEPRKLSPAEAQRLGQLARVCYHLRNLRKEIDNPPIESIEVKWFSISSGALKPSIYTVDKKVLKGMKTIRAGLINELHAMKLGREAYRVFSRFMQP